MYRGGDYVFILVATRCRPLKFICHATLKSRVTRHRKNLTLSNEIPQHIVDVTTRETLCADALFTKRYFNLSFTARGLSDSVNGFEKVLILQQFVTGKFAKSNNFELNLVVAYNYAAEKTEREEFK